MKQASGNSKIFATFILIFLVSICFFPLSLKNFSYAATIYRVLASSLAGSFIFTNENQALSLHPKLSCLLTYIGDASYTIYLIHWPLIIFFKYFSIQDHHGMQIFWIFLFPNPKISFGVVRCDRWTAKPTDPVSRKTLLLI